MNFNGLTIKRTTKISINLFIFLDLNSNFLEKTGEYLQLVIFSYLNVADLINFCDVSRYYKKLILKKFEKYYNLATGFCSIYSWNNAPEDNIWGLFENIYNELNNIYAFDFELNYDGLF